MHPVAGCPGSCRWVQRVCAVGLPMQSHSVSAPLEHTILDHPILEHTSLVDTIRNCARSSVTLSAGGFVMYAVIRTGGKQYRVAPGDVLKIESVPSGSPTVEFSDVLAVSGESGSIAKPAEAKVTAEVLGEGRGDKILVFHFKRKKQYKKLQGHRQNFTEVRIKAIVADGVTYDAKKK